MGNLIEKLFGNYSTKELKRIKPTMEKVLSFEEEYKKLSDQELRAKTDEFKKRLADGQTLDQLLPEAFATVREAARRVISQVHYPVQVLGGIILHQGRIAEMKTGEGKTLVSTLAAYLNALTGKGVHIVTVNDYLAKSQSEWMGKIYEFLGLKVGLIVHGLTNEERRKAYAADITYATNNELGFDYLRDNMVIRSEDMVQRGHHFAIVDEVDSILIDEARTPLIISGMSNKSTQLYQIVDAFVQRLKKEVIVETDTKAEEGETSDADYIVDEKARTATLTAKGIKKAEEMFQLENLSDPQNMLISHHINQAIKAYGTMKRDVNYVVKEGQVIIVDEHTGRLMFGRRYSDGLHQAIEAKEGVKVESESKTLATITFQNFFRLYDKLSGMTGTAKTEEVEFREIYSLDVVEVPTNKPVIRDDMVDSVYKTEKGKYLAAIRQIKQCHEKGQPVLVGTISVEKSEELSKLLKKEGIKHEVLNAKFHEKEADIVAQAGRFGAVTISTNMAGRGTDILLGGNPENMAKNAMKKDGYEDEMIANATSYANTTDGDILEARRVFKGYEKLFEDQLKEEKQKVIEAGGLFVLGTERHESRRIDNQLRGRSGRQGDPGASKFFLSLEDDLMRLFGSDRIKGLVTTLGLEEDEPIDAKMLSNAIESAQKKVEARNFETRKHVLQYDEVMNEQRKVIYSQRLQVLRGESMREVVINMIKRVIDDHVDSYCVGEIADNWDVKGLSEQMRDIFGLEEEAVLLSKADLETIDQDDYKERILNLAMDIYKKREEEFGDNMRELERVVMLKVVDQKWMDHLDDMEQLKQGIGLRAYGQKDPVAEYKIEGADMFDAMIENIRNDTVKYVYRARLVQQSLEREQVAKPVATSSDGTVQKQPVHKEHKVGRNDPCPCGSGLKYKKCCGKDE
jgi:preprotein translocase subunit SecA